MEVDKETGKVYERFLAGEKRGGLVGAGLSSRFSRSRIDAHIFFQHFEKVRARWLGIPQQTMPWLSPASRTGVASKNVQKSTFLMIGARNGPSEPNFPVVGGRSHGRF